MPFSLLASGQEGIKKYVQQNAIPILAIAPDATDYRDLRAINKAIGNATIVMLGEQDHGDAATFEAKTRLIKYLHEEKGFDVLAFESDFFSLNEGWSSLGKEKAQIGSFLRSNIYPIWSQCDACDALLYQYIPNTHATKKPLQITGFDSDLVLDYASSNLIPKLDSVFQSLELPITKSNSYRSQVLPVLDSLRLGFFTSLNDSFYARSSSVLWDIKSQLLSKITKDNFWVQVIGNLISASINHQKRSTDVIMSFNARDSQMAENLKWLSTIKYKDRKMIVWAANTHIGKSTDTLIKNKSGQGFTTMGAYFTRDTLLQSQTYILGFTSNQGKTGRLTLKEYVVPPPRPGTFESWFDPQWNYAFIDFGTYNRNLTTEKEPFFMKGFGHFTEKENWTKVFDGIFYIRDMYPCKR